MKNNLIFKEITFRFYVFFMLIHIFIHTFNNTCTNSRAN